MAEIWSKTLWIYGLAIVVSLLIAVVIKLIVVLLGRGEQRTASAPQPVAVTPRNEHRVFSHKFVQYGSTVLYDSYIIMPTANEHASVC